MATPMSFETAQRLASRMAQKGDIEGITKLLAKLQEEEEMNPVFIRLLSTFYEAAALHLGRTKPSSSP